MLVAGWRGSSSWARVLTADHREGEGDTVPDARDSDHIRS